MSLVLVASFLAMPFEFSFANSIDSHHEDDSHQVSATVGMIDSGAHVTTHQGEGPVGPKLTLAGRVAADTENDSDPASCPEVICTAPSLALVGDDYVLSAPNRTRLKAALYISTMTGNEPDILPHPPKNFG